MLGRIEGRRRRGRERMRLVDGIIDSMDMQFHAKMGTVKDRIGKNIKQKRLRRGGKNTQKNNTKMILMTWTTTMV